MQCKDINEYSILRYIQYCQDQFNTTAKLIDIADIGIAHPTLRLPFNLIRAKMKNLVKRGLVYGCTCGCRGDFELSPNGRLELASYEMPPEKLSN